MADSEIVGKKHIIAYLKVFIGYSFFLIPVTVLFIWLGMTTRYRVPAWLALAVLGLDLLIAFGALRAFMELKKFSWTLTEEGVDIRSGWFSWQKTHFDIPYETIFEAYYTFGFFAKMLGYGTCVIRRTEGVTSAYEATLIARAGTIVGAINKRVKELRAEAKQARIMQAVAPAPTFVSPADSPKSAADQIRELVALKAEGALTTEEFEAMKRRVVEG